MLSATKITQKKLNHKCHQCEPITHTQDGQPVYPAWLNLDRRTVVVWCSKCGALNQFGVPTEDSRASVQRRGADCHRGDILFRVCGTVTKEFRRLHASVTSSERSHIERQTEAEEARNRKAQLRSDLKQLRDGISALGRAPHAEPSIEKSDVPDTSELF